MELPAEPVRPDAPRPEATRLPALARYWWLTAVRGLVALILALAIVVAGRGTDRLVTFLGLYWMAGGLITLRFALAVRPRRGARLGLVAGLAAVVGALLVLLRHGLAGLVEPELLVELASTEVRPEVIGPVAAAWGVVSGSLLVAEGMRLRRFARTST